MYSSLKIIHVSFAILSIASFVSRGFWTFSQSAILDRLFIRVVPHVIDTAFLISGIWLVVALKLQVTQQDWLLTKFAVLFLYIVFGAIALKPGRTMQVRGAAFATALLTYLYIAGVALNKSPASWMAMVGD